MTNQQLRFLHLSDIHFKLKSELDPDEELQQALINDAEIVVENLNGLDGILVTGDIAFGGKESQYETAKVWLNELCSRTGTTIESVRTIPGNHDVDRDVLTGNPLLIDARNALRDATPIKLDERIRQYLEHSRSQDTLMEPTVAYNRFAGTLRCAILPGKLWWDEDFILNDGSTLRIRGLHSALLCDSDDTDEIARHKMILGSAQVNLGHSDGVSHLVMCHHPFDWIRDVGNAEQALNAYASIQLFGHKHTFELNTLNGRVLRLGAGAMQPDRREPNWEPRYNFLGISVSGEAGERKLQVQVWPRVWNRTMRRFRPDYASLDGPEFKVLSLKLPDWRGRPTKERFSVDGLTGTVMPHEKSNTNAANQSIEDASNSEGVATNEKSSTPQTISSVREAIMRAKRKLIHAYLSLSFSTIISIAARLNLIHDEDEGVAEQELFNRFIERAEQEGILGNLWDEVAQHESLPPNPFNSSMYA